jgi:prepilin-type N-terminal cleavage/methylation domain-containing protein
MKRSGFTMIELIFVIVILGILASVALPKLIGVKGQADEGVIKSFVGTLNRTVSPAKWSASIAAGGNGSIKTATYDINISDTDFPAAFAAGSHIDTTKCVAGGTTPTAFVLSTSDGQFSIECRDGNSTTAPKFWYVDGNTSKYDFNDSQALKLP